MCLRSIIIKSLFLLSLSLAQGPFNGYGIGTLQNWTSPSEAGASSIGLVPSYRNGIALSNPTTWHNLRFTFLSISYNGFESSLKNSENDNSLENLISENSALQRQIDLLKIELENSNKNGRQPVEPLETVELEDLRAELAKMKEEREEEKKELQSLYDQLSSALAGSGETV